MKIITDVNHLRKKCAGDIYFNSKVVANKMLTWLISHKNIEKGSIGLACNQLGLKGRVILVKIADKWQIFINPRITMQSSETIITKEQCLSVPDVEVEVERSHTIYMRDDYHSHIDKQYIGKTAIIIQHEIDHLDGVIISDKNAVVKQSD